MRHKIKIEKYFTIGHIINELFEELVESTIVQPTFVYGHPIEISPLAAKNKKIQDLQIELNYLLMEEKYANMFTELHDPIDQLERFENQLKEGKLVMMKLVKLIWIILKHLNLECPLQADVGLE